MAADLVEDRTPVIGNALLQGADTVLQAGIPQSGGPFRHGRCPLAHQLRRNRIESEMAEERAGKADVGKTGSVSQQKRSFAKNGLQLVQGTQVNRFHTRYLVLGDTVARGVALPLAPDQHPALDKQRQRLLRCNFLSEMGTGKACAPVVVPAVVHRRTPQPLIGVIFQQQAEEALQWINGNNRRRWVLVFEPLDDGRGVAHPATVGELQSGHLRRSGLGPYPFSLARVGQGLHLVGDTLDPEIVLQLTGEVGDAGTVNRSGKYRIRRH